MRNIGPYFIVAAAFLWSTDALFRKPLTGTVSSTEIVFLEHLLGLGILLPLLAGKIHELKGLAWRDWLAVFAIGVGGSALATVMFTSAFSYVGPSVAILLQKVQPLVAIFLAIVILKESPKRMFWLWAFVAIAAAFVISFPDLKITWSLYDNGTRGVLYSLGAAFLWGASTVFGRYVIKKISYPTMSALRFIVAAITLFVVLLVQGGLPAIGNLNSNGFFGLLGIVLISGTTPILLYYRGLKTTRASVSTILELIFPLSAVILNWLFLEDRLVWQQIIGGLLMVFAVIRIQMANHEAVENVQREPAPAGTTE